MLCLRCRIDDGNSRKVNPEILYMIVLYSFGNITGKQYTNEVGRVVASRRRLSKKKLEIFFKQSTTGHILYV